MKRLNLTFKYILAVSSKYKNLFSCYRFIYFFQRFFILDTGILKYGKSQQDLSKGKIHGQVDIGMSVISTKSKRKRIDIDTEEFIYHLKVK